MAAVDTLISDMLKTNINVDTVLSFAGRGLKLDCANDAKPVVDAMGNQKQLTALKLEGNTLGIEAASAIGDALAKHPEFERALWSDMFTGRLKSEIPDALKHLSRGIMSAGAQLQELDLSDNAFGPNGMIGLTDLLKSSHCYSLKELRLNNNGLGTTGGKMLAEALDSCYTASLAAGKPLQLRVFVSGRGRLENEGATALSAVFKKMGSLEEVSMPQNGINHAGITALAAALAYNKNLRILNLSDNTFTEKGAMSMAQALPHLQQLEVINFDDCLVRSDGVGSIATAISPSHTKLRLALFNFNEIRIRGAVALAEAMANKSNLEQLGLNGNCLGDEGVEQIQEIMERLGKSDMLVELDEDEGDEEDDEEEGPGVLTDSDEEEQDKKAESREILDAGDKIKDMNLKTSPNGNIQPSSTPADFLLFPSPSKLQGIPGRQAEAIANHLGNDIDDIDKAMDVFMKVSSVVTATDMRTKEIAWECTDKIVGHLCRNTDENAPSALANAILVALGLLKSEDKRPAPTDISGALIILEHTVRQSYFPKLTREILQLFLSKPHKLLEKSKEEYHSILQTLYKF